MEDDIRTEITRDADDELAFEAAVRRVVHEELASMGGDLLSTYGHKPDSRPELRDFGGYLLQRFGKK